MQNTYQPSVKNNKVVTGEVNNHTQEVPGEGHHAFDENVFCMNSNHARVFLAQHKKTDHATAFRSS
jgi:hypothetical protein